VLGFPSAVSSPAHCHHNTSRLTKSMSAVRCTHAPASRTSSATYDAPMTSVLPGGDSNENRSSLWPQRCARRGNTATQTANHNRRYLLMASSLTPGMSGYFGRPPTAITMLSAVMSDSYRCHDTAIVNRTLAIVRSTSHTVPSAATQRTVLLSTSRACALT
jgi:hypothetical protein